MAETLSLPGFVNAHSHAFQRALRGRTEGDDFWGWRKAMLSLAEGLSVEQVRAGYVEFYREMLAAGYTAVGEFHYLGRAEAHAAVGPGRVARAAQVVELADRGVAGTSVAVTTERGPAPHLFDGSAPRQREHRLAPAPEVVPLGATAQRPLKGV